MPVLIAPDRFREKPARLELQRHNKNIFSEGKTNSAAPKRNRAEIIIFYKFFRYDPKDQKPIRLPAIQPVS